VGELLCWYNPRMIFFAGHAEGAKGDARPGSQNVIRRVEVELV
jgi:hypothetical protein